MHTYKRARTYVYIRIHAYRWVLLYSRLPAQAEKLHRYLWSLHPALDGSALGGLNASEINPEIAWWALAIVVWRLLGHWGAELRLPGWVLPLLAIGAHFASGAGVLPCPFIRVGGCGIGAAKIPWLPPLKSPAGKRHSTDRRPPTTDRRPLPTDLCPLPTAH